MRPAASTSEPRRRALAAGLALLIAASLLLSACEETPAETREDVAIAKQQAAQDVGEAFLTGGVMALIVVYRPHWCSTFDDARYLRPR